MTHVGDPPVWEVRQGDALALLRDLPDATVDAVITDPPYSSGGFTRGDRMAEARMKYPQGNSGVVRGDVDFAGDNRDQRGYAYWCALWLAECLRATRPGGFMLAFTDWRQLPTTTDAIQAGGWVWRGIVPWVKTVARPQAGRFTNAAEYIVWGTRGSLGVDYTAPVLPGWYVANSPRERDHITQKPLEVMRPLVRITPPGGLVLDPFAGSGTTGVAAIAEGRRFLGFELTAHYAQVARERCAEIADGYCRTNPEQQVLL